jgi:hypothetical protein
MTEDKGLLYLGTAWLSLNLINMAMWTMGASVHPAVYGLISLLAMLAFGYRSLVMWVILSLTLIFALLILSHPVVDWDARFIWMFHAKRMFYDGTLYGQLDGYANWSHNDYPNLVPALAASLARAVGHWNEIIPRTSVLFALVPALLVAALTLKHKGVFYLWVAVVIAVAQGHLLNGYMDVYVGLYFGLGLVLLWSPQPKWLWSLVVLSLMLLKNEGLLAAALLILAFGLIHLRQPKQWWWGVWPVLVYALLWKLPLVIHQVQGDLFQENPLARGWERLGNPEELLLLARAIQLNIGAVFWLIPLTGMLIWRLKDQRLVAAWVLLVPLSYAAVVTGIYLVTPHALEWHLHTSADRVFMVFNLAIITLFFAHLNHFVHPWLSEKPKQAHE